MKISATSLSSYLYCARKLFLERVFRLVEIPKEALVKGSIRHNVYDIINKKEELIVKSFKRRLHLVEIEGRYRRNYSKILREVILVNKYSIQEVQLEPLDLFKKTWPYFQHEAKIRSINIFNFINDHNVLGEDLWNNLYPKIESELKVESDALCLKGIIDQVEVWPEKYVPIELKTGKAPSQGVWPGHRVQLGCYAMLAEERYNTKVHHGFVNYLDTFERREVVMNSYIREEVLILIRKVKELLDSEEIPDHCQNENKCSACSLKPLCYDEKFIENKMKEVFPDKQTKSLNIT